MLAVILVTIIIMYSIKWGRKWPKEVEAKSLPPFLSFPFQGRSSPIGFLATLSLRQAVSYLSFFCKMDENWHLNSGWAARLERTLGLDLEVLEPAKVQTEWLWAGHNNLPSLQMRTLSPRDFDCKICKTSPRSQSLNVAFQPVPAINKVPWKTKRNQEENGQGLCLFLYSPGQGKTVFIPGIQSHVGNGEGGEPRILLMPLSRGLFQWILSQYPPVLKGHRPPVLFF